jgi:hypothetical protein
LRAIQLGLALLQDEQSALESDRVKPFFREIKGVHPKGTKIKSARMTRKLKLSFKLLIGCRQYEIETASPSTVTISTRMKRAFWAN